MVREREIDPELVHRFDTLCKIAIKRSTGSADDSKVDKCIKILMGVASGEDVMPGEARRRLKELGIMPDLASRLVDEALRLGRRYIK